MTLSRREFIAHVGAVGIGFSGLQILGGCNRFDIQSEGYGSLVSDPNGLLDLPEGFTYRVISRMGDRMSDGFFVPGMPDGMAAFAGNPGQSILVRNHELNHNALPMIGPFGSANELLTEDIRSMMFDQGRGNPCLGGTTTLVVDNDSLEVEVQFLSLCGTVRNCAGGPTPGGSWITCEESEVVAGLMLEESHGYAFEVQATDNPRVQFARPIRAMGRFNREAVAVHPPTGIVYQTEDRGDGLFYRYLPANPDDLHAGGRLQALRFADVSRVDTRNWRRMTVPVGETYNVTWVDLDNVESPLGDLRHRGHAAGAARFARGEGIWYGNDTVYFACTNGGRTGKGQIWKYSPSPFEGGEPESRQPATIELFVQPDRRSVIENADNLTVAPWGDLMVCEDGPRGQHLVGVKPDGSIFKFARNAISNSELAGATFASDGSVLFVNIQEDGYTFAIKGPWTPDYR